MMKHRSRGWVFNLTVSEDFAISVLHVDDDASILNVTKMILNMEGNFKIESASSVDEALKKLEDKKYDVVVSDFEMPQKNGLDFLKELRGKNNHVPFILFTGKGREEVAVLALNIGADGYYNKHGSPETVYGELAHGIKKAAQRKKAEDALHISEEKFSKAFKNGPNAVTITRLSDGKIIEANDSIVNLLGYVPEEIFGRTTLELDIWANANDRIELVKALSANGSVHDQDLVLRRKDGTQIAIILSASLIEIGNEKCIISSFIDVTARKKAEEALIQTEKVWERTFNSIPDYIAIIDTQYRISRVNQAMANQIGVTADQAVGLKCYESVHGMDHPPDFCPHTQTLADGKEHVAEIKELGLGGEFLVSTSPLEDAQGNLVGSVHVARNITERKKAEPA